MSNGVKEIIIETAKKRRRVPKTLNAPELPLDAPDYNNFVQRFNQQSKHDTPRDQRNPDATLPGPGTPGGPDDADSR